MSELTASAADCVSRIREILRASRAKALQSVNAAMISAYWYIGREIVEEEQRGRDRADYGAHLIQELSNRLSAEFGKGFSVPNLRLIRQFYLTYRDRYPQIHYAVSSESQDSLVGVQKRYSVSSELEISRDRSFQPELSWTHYRVLMRVKKPKTRSFYEVECSKAHWSVRELERQIGSLLYKRLARSRDKKGLLDLVLRDRGDAIRRESSRRTDPLYGQERCSSSLYVKSK